MQPLCHNTIKERFLISQLGPHEEAYPLYKKPYTGDINAFFTPDEKEALFYKSLSDNIKIFNDRRVIINTIIEEIKNILNQDKKQDQTLLYDLNRVILLHTNDDNRDLIFKRLYNHAEYTDFKKCLDLMSRDYFESMSEIGIDTQLYDLEIVKFMESLSIRKKDAQKKLMKKALCCFVLIALFAGSWYLLRHIIKDLYGKNLY